MIKVLIVTQKQATGLNYHRQIVPHKHLVRNYPNEYQVDYCYDISEATKEQLQNYQMVSFLRLPSEMGNSVNLIFKCKQAGCKVVIDIDDYWELPKNHGLYKKYLEYDIKRQTEDSLKNADLITTTTSIFAGKLFLFNNNVEVLANSIDEQEEQYNRIPTASDRIRFGWIGGVHHHPDLEMIFEEIKKLWKTADKNKFQLCLGGFGNNANYIYLEKIFTDNYKYIRSDIYKKYLKEFTKENNQQAEFQPYKRLWGTSVFEYAKLYNEIDVALVPLYPNAFSGYKSQLKIIEAGWFKKAAIVSNTSPYIIDCTNRNSILIPPDKRGRGWASAINSLILHPERIEELGNNLHEHIINNYTTAIVNKARHHVYQNLCK